MCHRAHTRTLSGDDCQLVHDAAHDLAPQRECVPELDSDHGPLRRAPALVQLTVSRKRVVPLLRSATTCSEPRGVRARKIAELRRALEWAIPVPLGPPF